MAGFCDPRAGRQAPRQSPNLSRHTIPDGYPYGTYCQMTHYRRAVVSVWDVGRRTGLQDVQIAHHVGGLRQRPYVPNLSLRPMRALHLGGWTTEGAGHRGAASDGYVRTTPSAATAAAATTTKPTRARGRQVGRPHLRGTIWLFAFAEALAAGLFRPLVAGQRPGLKSRE